MAWPLLTLILALFAAPAPAQPVPNRKYLQEDKFRQLEEILPTPNLYRTASGAPGPGYWQQRADYVIDVELDDERREIRGAERITYTNNSPQSLNYVWLQLEPNYFRPDADSVLTQPAPGMDRMSFDNLKARLARQTFDGGVKIGSIHDAQRRPLRHTVVKTMLRIDLPEDLAPGEQFVFHVEWSYTINDTRLFPARTGYEFFEKDGNCIYEIAHWYPRLAAYTDATGWQHKQFLGQGEFTLELGDYVVRITAPDDHVVAATGMLLNPNEVLSETQRSRLLEAETAKEPVWIVTPAEAEASEAKQSPGKKTWVFQADHVRDFAFASSRKFAWDAMRHEVEGNRVMAMSFFPKEAEPLWHKYSTHAIVHTLDVYSRYTFPYPYPVAISVNGPVYGMEYPMICFNGPRPEPDGTYARHTKYALISVIIHEVGHNYFPMIVNSDERQWTWMDEGINSFLQYLAEQEWEHDYPSGSGEPRTIVDYMRSSQQVPIMTNSESILQFGNNAYDKPATALNILRETVLGRELFDHAFKEYARRWRFKRPMPADFFRTMEDASGVDLDWFWRGWFYSTDHCDQAIEGVRLYEPDTRDPEVEKPRQQAEREARPRSIAEQRNTELPRRIGHVPDLKDFYNDHDPLQITDEDRKAYERFLKELTDEQREHLKSQRKFYVVDLRNVGGLVMPVILKVEYEGGESEEIRIPAEIWRRNAERVSKLIIAERTIESITLDPHLETADIDLSNNHFPPRIVPSRFQLFRDQRQSPDNPIRQQRRREEAARKAAENSAPQPPDEGG